jgi:peptidyl-prolyl cis-trans isomerase D
MLFNLSQGKSRIVADPSGGGFAIVKLSRVLPGNASLQPSLIAQVQRDFQQPATVEYARQFLSAVRQAVGVKRNEEALADTKKRLLSGS